MGLLTTSSKTSKPAPASPATGGLPEHLQRAMAKVTELSSLPEITARIVEVVEDPRATASDMHDIVKNDPALASKILKVVNSAFYGLPAQVASLDRAILMLGLSAVKNIALAASLARLFKPGALSEQFTARDLWRHCVAVGVCGRQLTKASTGIQDGEAFVAGLVHDLGLLVEYQLFPDKLKEVINRSHADEKTFCELEMAVIEADHQAFGAALAAKWKFPPALRSVISHHHNPLTLKPELMKIATVAHIADTICCEQQHGFWLTAARQTVTDEVLEVLAIRRETLEEIAENLPEQVEEAQRVFGD